MTGRRDAGPEGPFDGLAAGFVVPAKSGVYLTKNELIALARVSEASLRVSERRRMLADVLKSAQSLEELRVLVVRLQDFCRLHVEEYEARAALFPASQGFYTPWIDRARATIARLAELDEELTLAEPSRSS